MTINQLLLDLIDLRSFSNLWYWIALAVTWSTASHWILGVPYDMVLRARRLGGDAMRDFETLTAINVARILYIISEAGLVVMALASCGLTVLALLGFWYHVEFCQALFLILFPMSIVGLMTARVAGRIHALGLAGEDLCRAMSSHRIGRQFVGIVSISVTAFWGMLQNFNLSPLN